MIRCNEKRWCIGMTAMLDHGALKKRQVFVVRPYLSTAISRLGDYVTIHYLRGKKIEPLKFSYCPFCGAHMPIKGPGVKAK